MCRWCFRYVIYADHLTKIAQLAADNDRMIDELAEKDKDIAKMNKEFACFSKDLKHASIIKIKERERKIAFLKEEQNQDRETYTSIIHDLETDNLILKDEIARLKKETP